MLPRWQATVAYRANDHSQIVNAHQIEELAELENIIEAGPDWDTIIEIRITKLRDPRPDYTIEQSVNE